MLRSHRGSTRLSEKEREREREEKRESGDSESARQTCISSSSVRENRKHNIRKIMLNAVSIEERKRKRCEKSDMLEN